MSTVKTVRRHDSARTPPGLCQDSVRQDSVRTLSGLCQDCQDRCGRSTYQVRHGDVARMEAHVRDCLAAAVRRAVSPVLCRPAEAADLVGGWRREAAAEVLMEQDLGTVPLREERVVVTALDALDVPLAGLVVEVAVARTPARLAAEVVEAALLLGVAEAVDEADARWRAALARRPALLAGVEAP